jgi:rubrerythrin
MAYDMSEIDGEHFNDPYMVVDVKEIQKLPSVTQKSGKWIRGEVEVGACEIEYPWWKCSECGWEHALVIPRNYCPNCGAKMESEDKE